MGIGSMALKGLSSCASIVMGGKGTVVVNGRSYVGNNVHISNGRVIIDGVVQEGEPLGQVVNIHIEGNVEQASTVSGDISCKGNAGSIETTNGDVTCGDVHGSVSTVSGDVKAKSIKGAVSTVSGDIRGARR